MTRSALIVSIAALFAGLGVGFFVGAEKTGLVSGDRAGSPAGEVGAGGLPDARAAQPAALSPDAAPEPAADAFHDNPVPAPTLTRLRTEKNPHRLRGELDELCAALDASGVRAFLAAMEPASSASAFDVKIVDALLARWAKIEPRAAADCAAQLDAGRQFSTIHAVLRTWAASDPAAARQWALGTKGREAHLYSVNAIVGVLAEHDVPGALAFLEALPLTENKSFYVSSLFGDLARKNPEQAAERAQAFVSRAWRQSAVGQVASVWGQKEPGKALAWFLQNESPQADGQWQSGEVARELLKNWVRTAPEEAADFATAQPLGAARRNLIDSLGKSWGALNPEAAAVWLQTLLKSSESYGAFQSLIDSWTESDPTRAGEFLLSQPSDRTRDWLLERVGSGWANEDPAAALAWARRQSALEIERLVAAQALAALAAKDLPNAARYFSQLKTPAAQTAAIESVVSDLAVSDPERAANWVVQMAATPPAGRALETALEMWAYRDPDAAGGWLNQQPAGAQRDAAVGGFTIGLADKDAPSAAAWAATIAEDGRRRNRVKAVVNTWAEKDPAAARAWVLEQGFAAAEQQELLKALERAGRK